ncbi:MAG: hypothetical protein UU74_C0039G0001 [Candidatus Woesebacteria bacterium GW2011_GWA1_41_7]|uniref:Uncharacterized protein n=1 Tax=Candidatus Woesebacteria bacterium GW2011_GWA1_41_7 TaxID=1618556 RepID=A0A0G0ZU67_9BACT|nr:MAG: hypothetical protein UU74_C0039G0001 [Candidatus Woesebacteria bacterium GW2011_GWA1_41_7]
MTIRPAKIIKISVSRPATIKIVLAKAPKIREIRLEKNTSRQLQPEMFLEEPGKTKLVGLLNLGEPENFVNLDPGEDVKLAAYSHRVSVTTNDGKYIGRLPDDISAKLKYLIKGGNKYQALIKSVSPKEITVFVRELEKGPGMEGSPSFAPEKIDYVSFTPPELVHSDTPSVETTEEIPEE